MVRISEGLALDDLLLVPQKSYIKSRFNGEIDISTQLTPNIKLDLPLIGSAMDTISDAKFCNAIMRLGGLGIIHRFMKDEDYFKEIRELNPYYYRVVGIGLDGLNRFKTLLPKIQPSAIHIDVAHAHTTYMIDFIRQIKKTYKIDIIVGSVCTYIGVYDLCEAGADAVRVGVGCGCLASGTRILMDDGTYKNIEDIKLHEKVINMDGKAVEVVAVKYSGMKKVYKYRNNSFYKDTFVTGEHLHFVGDYSSSAQSIMSTGFKKSLERPEGSGKNKRSKLKWKRTDEVKDDVWLVPNDIEFNLPETFSINLSDFAFANRNWKGFREYPIIKPSYNLGYIFGSFLGDGNANVTKSKRFTKDGRETRNYCGNLAWYFGKDEGNIANKLANCLNAVFGSFSNVSAKSVKNIILVSNRSNPVVRLFMEFGKKENKYLPAKYMCNNIDYLRGIYDGLIDSDGSSPSKNSTNSKDERDSIYNTSEGIIELSMFLFKILYGYYPSIVVRKPTIGNLKNCNIENCKTGYSARGIKNPEWRMVGKYQFNQLYKEIEETNLYLPTYDIEVDCSTHSFVANNVIVHNSACSTRIQTGNGVPQATALMEAKKAVIDYKIATKRKVSIICDGGVRNAGDVVKALACGADAVMSGFLFAGTEETPGELKMDLMGKQYKIYRGMSSVEAQKEWKGHAKSVEGGVSSIPYKGKLKDVVDGLVGNIFSGMSYQGAINIKGLQNNAEFVKITNAGMKESKLYKEE